MARILCLAFVFLSGLAQGQAIIQFNILTKTPAFSGIAVGYAKDDKSIFVRDWENYYHYSPEANTWSKLKFRKKPRKLWPWATREINAYARKGYKVEFPILTKQIPLSFLPSFSKILLISDELEILDTELLELSYVKIEGGAPISTGHAVFEEKVYVFGGMILAPKITHGRAYKWDTEFSNKMIVFDPANLSFQELEEMPEAMLCQGAFVNGSLYAFGVEKAGSSFSLVLRYDPNHNQWDTLEKVPIDISASAIASNEQQIFMVGTHGIAGYLGVYDTVTNTYTEFPTNVHNKMGVACIWDNKLHYFGGIDVDFPGWINRSMYVLDLASLPK